jgi:hypothetical protein
MMNQTNANRQDELFTTEATGLPEVASPGVIRLDDGDRLDLRIGRYERAWTAPSGACLPITGRAQHRRHTRQAAPAVTNTPGRRAPLRSGSSATPVTRLNSSADPGGSTAQSS